MNKRHRILLASASGLALSLTATLNVAHASGFGLREGSADWLGNAFAGETAKAYDASTAYANPAGMALLDHSEFEADASYIAPSATFSGSNNNAVSGGSVSGVNGGNAIQPAASGATFGVWALNPDWRLGFGVTAPYGERASYPGDFVGRYQSLDSSITDINVALAASYKVNNHLSIGGGPTIDYFSARLTQANNAGTLSLLAGDSTTDLSGDDVGVGYNLGILYKFNDNTRVGLDYRSRVQHEIDGSEHTTVPAAYASLSPATAAFLAAQNGSVKTSITLPDSVSLGLYHQINDQWAVMSDISWTHWALFNSLNVTPTSGNALQSSESINENWRNTWFVGVGVNYQATEKWKLQFGVSYDQSPVTDSNRTTRVPDADHYNVGIGTSYAVTPQATVQVAYLHVFTPGGNINNSASTTAGTLTGSYDASDDSVTAGFIYKF